MTGTTSKDKNTPTDAGQSFDRARQACTGKGQPQQPQPQQPQQQQMPCFSGEGTCPFAAIKQEQQGAQLGCSL